MPKPYYDRTWEPCASSDSPDAPLRWVKPARILVRGLFDYGYTFVGITRAYAVMRLAQHHTFLVTCVDTARALEWYEWLRTPDGQSEWLKAVVGVPDGGKESWSTAWPFRNIWLGAIVRNQSDAPRIDMLLRCPAALHWVCFEKMNGKVDIVRFLADPEHGNTFRCKCGFHDTENELTPRGKRNLCLKCGEYCERLPAVKWVVCDVDMSRDRKGFDVRPSDIESLVWQCKKTDVPLFLDAPIGPFPRYEMIPGDKWPNA